MCACCANPAASRATTRLPRLEPMISVEEALTRLLAPLEAVPPEQVSIADALGRVLAEDVAARRTQPPFAVSAMDGYAVRAEDVETVPIELRIVAEVPAGAGFVGQGGPREGARIFTRAPLPAGAGTTPHSAGP